MNFLSIDICSRRPEREVQFFEALMFNGYQYRRTPLRCGDKCCFHGAPHGDVQDCAGNPAELKEQAEPVLHVPRGGHALAVQCVERLSFFGATLYASARKAKFRRKL
ncbi:hypothetical protein [Paraburkholderia sp. MM5384-R2]|uniref:hypothetical protein n=1 Tax=Paraburkholderia sp. MM5384-R2 TaxID=2723097 RepID=UPI00160C5EA7|nr:hypothetical protein [Paraburkholderia sp. MM5384-R2]MBB5502330.1 hypothetical protein [Paraburkholderia sp. MM5384-R2]